LKINCLLSQKLTIHFLIISINDLFIHKYYT